MSRNFTFNYSVATNKGIRPINEDANWIGFNKNHQGLIVVCDGIGSQDDSQIASLVTVEVFKKAFEKHAKIFNIDHFFARCLKTAYNQITKRSAEKLNGKKIGTTLVVSFIDKSTVTTFNLGDSRLYHYSFLDDNWTQITKDHNLYNYFLDLAEKDSKIDINELCARHRAQLLSLTKCLESGTNAHKDYDKFIFNIALGDVLFQATDGVYHFLKLADVNNVIKTNNNNFNVVSGNLIEIALENRSNDNLTCIIMECANADSKSE